MEADKDPMPKQGDTSNSTKLLADENLRRAIATYYSTVPDYAMKMQTVLLTQPAKKK
jgi:hypothetical protein